METYRTLGWTFQFEHVKSHQDNTVPLADLPLEVQLHVEADCFGNGVPGHFRVPRPCKPLPIGKVSTGY
jgi:hypothetical protein